jgi:diguanylate cyclase (GGDEF)-like protein
MKKSIDIIPKLLKRTHTMKSNFDQIAIKLIWIERDGVLHGMYESDGKDSNVEIHLHRDTGLFTAIDTNNFPPENSSLKIEPTHNLAQLKIFVREFLMYDSLTNLLGRRQLECILENEIQKIYITPQPISLISMDIDYMSRHNDTFGHKKGDSAIATIASLINDCLGLQGWVGRYSGDEFLTVLPDTCLEEAVTMAEKMKDAVQTHPFPFSEEHKTRLGISVGVSCSSELTSLDLKSLINLADQRLYQAKIARKLPSN